MFQMTSNGRSFPRTSPLSDIDRVFAEVFGAPAARGAASCAADDACCAPVSEFAPVLDISESDGAYTVHAEVPGLAPDDVQVTVEEDVLTVRGEKKAEHVEADGKVHRSERRYGAFSRSVQFPVGVDAAQVTAVHRLGVLTVRLPKVAKTKATQVKVVGE
ncbi:MAG: Hsp20/alpha crystallin family protein [Planctomycetes bacterium]|nr:Hsp20/alpha crystallin family protein [Planctomycetota bacterium]